MEKQPKVTTAPDKRPAMAFDRRREIMVIMNALENYRNEYALESIDYSQEIEHLKKEFQKLYKMFDKK